MTELYIKKQQVVLPETFSITIIEENPFFTKNGKYTYDITLSLLDPTNARIYKHLNRMNRKGDIPKNRSAYLVVDNEVVLNGTEIILEYTNTEVKIVLASGNSELNFLIGGDRKLRDLELGEASLYKGNSFTIRKNVYNDLKKTYPDVKWLLLPYAPGYNANLHGETDFHPVLITGNPYSLSNDQSVENDSDKQIGYPRWRNLFSGQVPQPFLCYIIELVLKALGYNVVYNAIAEHDVFRKMYIVHGRRTAKFAKMLPGWTVNEFIEELEKFFDCTFVIDYERNVRIYFNYEATNPGQQIQLSNVEVLDQYTTEIDSENVLTMSRANIAYNLDTTSEPFRCLTNYARSQILSFERISSVDDFITYLNSSTDWKTSEAFSKVYRFIDDDFIIYQEPSGKYTLQKIDQFKPLMNNKESSEIDIELNIVPAAMTYNWMSGYTSFPYKGNAFWQQVPIAEDYDPLDPDTPESESDDNTPVNLQELIENESSPTDTASSKMVLAMYSGLSTLQLAALWQPEDEYIQHAFFPVVKVESLSEALPSSGKAVWYGTEDNPFRLSYLDEEIYSKNTGLDTTITYKMSFVAKGNVNIENKIIANNKAFRCIKIERTVTSKGFEKLVKGEFYSYQ